MRRLTRTIWLCLMICMSGGADGPMAQTDAETYNVMKSPDAVVHYPEKLKAGASELLNVYPVVKGELESLFGWPLRMRPTIVLVGDRNRFQRMSGDDRVEAFARPYDRLIVMDYSRMAARPLRTITTLKHEMVHLLLHEHVIYVSVPKWLNEGIAQWASGGVAEVLVSTRKSLISDALRAGRLPSLRQLEQRFPADRHGFSLAYEQSLSIVNYMEHTYGRQAVINLLGYMKNGATIDQAVQDALNVGLADLEYDWRGRLKARESWLTFLSVHIYEFIFLLGALLTFTGFVRYWIRKKNYRDDPEEDDWE